LSAQTMLLEGT